jgi:hydroxyethylthiazole kinase-like uncharacterized protein yjeF
MFAGFNLVILRSNLMSIPAMTADKITKEQVQRLLQPRKKDAEKRDFGHLLLIGGSYGMIGAVSMAAKAALRSGAGLVTILAPRCGYGILQSQIPEAMILPSSDDEYLEILPDLNFFEQIAVGPGLGRHKGTATFIDLLLRMDKPMLIDADALNIISEHHWQPRIPKGSLLTPNIREFDRLFPSEKNKDEYPQILREKATELNCYILRKGAGTQLAFPDGSMYVNTTGNPGMAKGGSGDVLTGTIAGLWSRLNRTAWSTLLSQGYTCTGWRETSRPRSSIWKACCLQI